VLGTILAAQEAVKHFDEKGGSIINLSSVVSTLGIPGAAVYSATKGAVNTLTLVLAKELGPKKIRVNGVAPGMVETEGTVAGGMTEGDFRKDIEAKTPVGRIGQPKDIASVVTFLASDEASWISGETWFVSGGFR